jgi:transposase-like protein
MVGQDCRGIKRITKSILGLKSFVCAAVTLAAIELYNMIRKGQNIIRKTVTFWGQFYEPAA